MLGGVQVIITLLTKKQHCGDVCPQNDKLKGVKYLGLRQEIKVLLETNLQDSDCQSFGSASKISNSLASLIGLVI